MPGVWQRAMAAISHGNRLQIQNSLDVRASMLTTAPSANIQQGPAQRLTSAAAEGGRQGVLAQHDSAVRSSGPAAERESSLTLSAADQGQSFW
jgi:hypothetical protein